MLTGYDIIYFGDQWDGVLRNRQQLMSIFARQNKVLFVEAEHHLKPVLDHLYQGNLRLSDWFASSIRPISDNLFVFRSPLWAPVSGRFPLKQLTKTVRWLCLKNAIRKLQISQPIIWFYHPKWYELVKKFPSARLLVYHVVDEYTSYRDRTPARRRRIEERESKMMDQVDAVVVVSQELYQAKCTFNANTYLVPNGVNYQAYTAALADSSLPDDLKVIKRPRLGYSGLIGDKLDFRMLKKLAHSNPGWSLIFLGRMNISEQLETWRALQAMPNVHYLGEVSWSQVPHYVKGFDVGLMPYLQNRHSETISPLKLYDYLAAGLPIASINIPAAREFGSYIHLADTPKDFARTIQAALADNSPERHQTRRDIAARHTWEVRVEQLSNLIEAQLSAKVQNR